MPFLAPYTTGTTEYTQQWKTPVGYYRDDRIVRERPDGSCDEDGSIQCPDDGLTFDICDQGGWVEMGPVPKGMTCVGQGDIVGTS